MLRPSPRRRSDLSGKQGRLRESATNPHEVIETRSDHLLTEPAVHRHDAVPVANETDLDGLVVAAIRGHFPLDYPDAALDHRIHDTWPASLP